MRALPPPILLLPLPAVEAGIEPAIEGPRFPRIGPDRE